MKKFRFLDLIGFNGNKISYKDCLVSGLGGFAGILAIFICTSLFLGLDVAVVIVPSMGASAVLLFASPQAPFSQPWNLVAGHAISALIGVGCWMLISNMPLAASVSVGLAISAMYFLRCVHPPGGATALAAVIGSEQLHALGFSYGFQPILFNVLVLLVVAVVFNALFKWRSYPSVTQPKLNKKQPQAISHEQFVHAVSQIETLVDISEEDLLRIYKLATEDASST